VERNLDKLIDNDLVAIVPPVRLELILGCRKNQRASLVKRIDALHFLPLSETTWKSAEECSMRLRDRGIKLGVVDVLIAASVSEQNACLWTLDKDFEPLFKEKFVKAFRSA
jgi:predicted nucleic acid-binding protein